MLTLNMRKTKVLQLMGKFPRPPAWPFPLDAQTSWLLDPTLPYMQLLIFVKMP